MLLKIDKASKTIKKKKVLDDVSAEFKSGLIYAVVGRNGSGKTMLFRALSGLMKVDSGAVTLDGRRLHKDFEMLPGLGIMLKMPDSIRICPLWIIFHFLWELTKSRT